jgi:hypothetical protein
MNTLLRIVYDEENSMPKYFLHQIFCDARVNDPEGADFESLLAVRAECLASAREIASELLLVGKGLNPITFEVTDEFGRIVLVVPFEDALKSGPTESD